MSTQASEPELQSKPRRAFRFEPLTVRAAARIVLLAEAGSVSRWDVAPYLGHLALADRYSGGRGQRALARLARRRAAFGQPGAPARMNLCRRRLDAPTPLAALQAAA